MPAGETSIGEQGTSILKGKHVVVLGAGGTARALVFGALSKGAPVTVANRCATVPLNVLQLSSRLLLWQTV